ncbi:cell adhesion molecule 1-like [Eriocheir sinensis]|uniref:cell adhesion molecule 1-like n=1 Tax=Eriocheir sinensis TaxID=95602 RepID=UPI0021C61DB7|nr:cell adhesion molecule 1-like [Eriocheir sinensis]XP_050698833.1 cell adhesion molecule 1-like [Eriocheir sinensis]
MMGVTAALHHLLHQLLLLQLLLLILLVSQPTQGLQEALKSAPSAISATPSKITWGRGNTNKAYFASVANTNITVMVGQPARLPCRVLNLDKRDSGTVKVSWIRQRDLHILTVDIFTYTSDERFKVFHPENSNAWHLDISSVTFRDSGVYECQVSSSPKIHLPIHLHVQVQQARVDGPPEVFVQEGSTIKLLCYVNTREEDLGTLAWYRGNTELDYDSPRGGVSVEIEKTPKCTTSRLFLTRATKQDSGNYTCAPTEAQPSTVLVHVVRGEESAAVQTGSSVPARFDERLLCWCVLLLLAHR